LFFKLLKSKNRPSENKPVASGFSLIGGPPTSLNVKLASTLGFARTSPVSSLVTAMTTASGIFKPGLSGSGKPEVQIVVDASTRLGFEGSCQRKNSCDCE